VSFPAAFLVVFAAFSGGFAFGSLAMVFTSRIKTIEIFNIPVFYLSRRCFFSAALSFRWTISPAGPNGSPTGCR